jgi:hypothetical protein
MVCDMNSSGNPPTRPDCFRCIHLKITWDKTRPYACSGMGFKSKQIPWRVVLRNSGKPCMLFKPKPGKD